MYVGTLTYYTQVPNQRALTKNRTQFQNLFNCYAITRIARLVATSTALLRNCLIFNFTQIIHQTNHSIIKYTHAYTLSSLFNSMSLHLLSTLYDLYEYLYGQVPTPITDYSLEYFRGYLTSTKISAKCAYLCLSSKSQEDVIKSIFGCNNSTSKAGEAPLRHVSISLSHSASMTIYCSQIRFSAFFSIGCDIRGFKMHITKC